MLKVALSSARSSSIFIKIQYFTVTILVSSFCINGTGWFGIKLLAWYEYYYEGRRKVGSDMFSSYVVAIDQTSFEGIKNQDG